MLNASYSVKQMIIECFDQECEKYQKKRDKRVFSLVFLDPSSPRLASSSPGPPNSFMVKKLARLGELQLPQSDPLPINRHPRGVLRVCKVHKWRELRDERKKRKQNRGTTESPPRSFPTLFSYFVFFM